MQKEGRNKVTILSLMMILLLFLVSVFYLSNNEKSVTDKLGDFFSRIFTLNEFAKSKNYEQEFLTETIIETDEIQEIQTNNEPNGLIDSTKKSIEINEGESIYLFGIGNDPDNDIPLNYNWDFDGGALNSNSKVPGNVVFGKEGTYVVKLIVTDSKGLEDSSPDTLVITVKGKKSINDSNFTQTQTAGTVYYVSTTGSNSNSGTSVSSPWRTIQFGISQLRAGDILNIRGGTYFEQVIASVIGTSTNPITIQAYNGEKVYIDSGKQEFRTVGNNDWELVNPSIGEWMSRNTYSGSNRIYAYLDGISGYMNERVALVNYHTASQFRATTDQYVDGTTPFYVGPGILRENNKLYIRLSKTSDMVAAENRYGTVLNSDNADPRQYSIILSDASYTLRISGSYLIFKDITVHQASRSIDITASASFITLDHIEAWNGDSDIEITGSHDIIIKNSRIYGDAPYWIFWTDMKSAPYPADYSRGTSVDLREGAYNIEISYNHIRGSGQDLIGTNHNEYNINIHHNRLENCGDDALELEGSLGYTELYENFVVNCLVGNAPGQDSPGFVGPLYVYRNLFLSLRNPPVNRRENPPIVTWNGGFRFGYEYLFKQAGSGFGTKHTHIYHNTAILLNSASKGLNIVPQIPDDAYVANNIFVKVNGKVNGNYPSSTSPGRVINGNIYWKINNVDTERLISSYDTVSQLYAATGFEQNGIGSVPKRGTDPLFSDVQLNVVDRTITRWELHPDSEFFDVVDFFFQSTSPARGAGISLPGTLPDTRTSNDLGAYPYGTSQSEYNIFPYVVSGSPIQSSCVDPDLTPSPPPGSDHSSYFVKSTVTIDTPSASAFDICDDSGQVLIERYCSSAAASVISSVLYSCNQHKCRRFSPTLDEGKCNKQPTAVINSDLISGPAPLTVSFDGTGSSDLDSDSLTYRWDFKDENTGTGQTIQHAFNVPGTYDVELIVNDGFVDSEIVTRTITVTSPQMPVINFISPTPENDALISDYKKFSVNMQLTDMVAEKFTLNVNGIDYVLPNLLSCNFDIDPIANLISCDNGIQGTTTGTTRIIENPTGIGTGIKYHDGGILVDNIDSLYFPNNQVNMNLNEGTIMFWIKVKEGIVWDTATDVKLFDSVYNPTDLDIDKRGLRIMEPGGYNGLRARIHTDSGMYKMDYSFGTNNFEQQSWNHVAVTYGAGVMTFYVNGGNAAGGWESSVPYLGTITRFNDNIYIGQDVNGIGQANAIFDEVKIYSSKLTQQEINNIRMMESGTYYMNFLFPEPLDYVYQAFALGAGQSITSEQRTFRVCYSDCYPIPKTGDRIDLSPRVTNYITILAIVLVIYMLIKVVDKDKLKNFRIFGKKKNKKKRK